MEQSPSWEANQFAAGQEIPRILCRIVDYTKGCCDVYFCDIDCALVGYNKTKISDAHFMY